MAGAGVKSPVAKPTQLSEPPRAGHCWLGMLNLKAFFFFSLLLQDVIGT